MFFRVAALLKRFADEYQMAVVCVNQVSDVMTALDGSAKAPVSPSSSTMCTALCLLPLCTALEGI